MQICLLRKIYFKVVFLSARYDEFSDYATKRAETQEKTQLRQNPVYENILNQEYQSSNSSVSVTTIKPLSAKMASSYKV